MHRVAANDVADAHLDGIGRAPAFVKGDNLHIVLAGVQVNPYAVGAAGQGIVAEHLRPVDEEINDVAVD